jgi:hypothetical protein
MTTNATTTMVTTISKVALRALGLRRRRFWLWW